MILRSCVTLLLLIGSGLTATPTRGRSEPTISECAAKGGECDETKGRPVCGTDDQTYPSRCHLIRVQCSGHQVSLKYRGPCKACIEAREYALKHKAFGKSPPKFIPRCKSDGTYAPVQCLGDSGCWCSDITGKPIENTSVRTGKPRCREFTKANIRRSPTRPLSPGNRSAGRRPCTQADRGLFNSNLIKIYQGEYLRTGLHKDPATAPVDRTVLDWKFSNLDANSNHMLDKNEYRELKKAVKRAVKPRRCSRAFGKFCDVNDDDRLSRQEWASCLSKDGKNGHHAVENNRQNGDSGYITPSVSNAQHHHQTINNNNPPPHQIHNHNLHKLPLDELDSEDDNESSQHLGDYEDSDDYDSDDGEEDDNISLNSFGSMVSTKFPSIFFLRPKMVDPEPVLRDSEGESDCISDRTVALDEQKFGGTALYVPECTADGRYQRVQCYRSTGYCWCVHEDTGKNIPGTSVKDKKPQCDSLYPVSRPMKGCPEPKKTEFLKDLKEFLKKQIATNGNTGVNATKWSSEDERIGTLSFVFLDKNKNKAWERKEWKTFRELVTANKNLRKCGKKMPRYCDVNSDKKITLSEWLNCLQAQRLELDAQKPTEKAEAVTNKPSKLNGPNPLESYLKE